MSNNTGGNARVLEGDLKKSSTEVWWERKNSSTSESPHSKQASSQVLVCCCCSLLVLIKVLKYVHANSMSPSPSGNLKTIYGPLLWLRLRFLSFSKHASFPNLKKHGQCHILIMVIQQLAKTPLASYTWICSLGLIYAHGKWTET
jgi:hypothetical protein